jgi:hypothetical protein
MTRIDIKNTQNQFNQQWENSSNKILATTIDGISSARKARLQNFSTPELEAELLSRQKCHFNRLTCTKKAEDYLIKPFNYQKNPTCFNCKQDILSLLKK